MEDKLITLAKKHFELMPEFPHLVLAHLALAIQGDDPDLNRGDLASFLAWALQQPGVEGEWGHCGAWLRFLCPRRYDHTKPSRDFAMLRQHFPAADAIKKRVLEESNRPKRFSIFLDASTQVLLTTPNPGKRRMKAALALGNELLSRLDEEGFEVNFHYEADNDGKPEEPAIGDVALYLSFRVPLSVSCYACVTSIKPRGESALAASLLDSFKEVGMTFFPEESLDSDENLPAAKKDSVVVDFPIPPRGTEEELKVWVSNFAAAVVKSLIVIDNSFGWKAQ